MKRLGAFAGLVAAVAFAGFVLFVPQDVVLAKSACMCQCAQDRDTTLKQPTGGSLQECQQNICPRQDVCNGAGNVSDATWNSGTNRCGCTCSTYTTDIRFANLTGGNPDCRADCSATCGGAENLITNGRPVDIACIPGSNDCRSGNFSIYEDTACVLQAASDPQNWSETFGQKPVCTVALTPKNANRECSVYGGIARGGTCGFLEDGQNIDGYFKSRPLLGAVGTDFAGPYGTYAAWAGIAEMRAPTNGTIPANAGICYRYGVTYGGAPTYDGFDPGPNGENVLGAYPRYDYVCLKPKTDTCGTVQPPSGQTPILPARSYSCQIESQAVAAAGAGRTAGTICFGGAELCASKPNTRCCQGGTGFETCLVNSDCSLDGSKICSSGTCVANVVCDQNANAAVPANSTTPWLYDQRRCRDATDVEKNDSDVCSPESILPLAASRCPNPRQACCRAPNPRMLSGCAADLVQDLGSASIYNDFSCMTVGSLPTSQFIDVGGRRQVAGIQNETGYTGGYPSGQVTQPHCLTSTLPRYENGRVVGQVNRCGGGQFCCNARRLDPNLATDTRPASGPCGGPGVTGYSCLQASAVLPPDGAASVSSLVVTRDSYFRRLVQLGACKATPLVPGGNPYNTQECRDPALCCVAGIAPIVRCTADAQCGSGMRCDPQIQACVPGTFLAAQQASDLCYSRAVAGGGADIASQIANKSGVDPTQFTCQFVEAGAEGVSTSCIPQGCEQLSGESGQVAQCCIPGAGKTPAATAAGTQTVTPPAAPLSLPLPPCIKAGNCTLNEIVATGAGFANFLIQISGAVFLGIFVYGGFKYLTAGASKRAAEGKEMIIKSAIGMVLLFAGFTFIQFIQSALVAGTSGGGQVTCGTDEATTNFQCRYLESSPTDAAAISREITEKACVRGKCPGPANYVCCPQ